MRLRYFLSAALVLTTAVSGCHLDELVRAPVAGLTFTVQPLGAERGERITPPVEVTVLNGAGTRDTSSTHVVTMTLGANPFGATLSGETEAQAVGGVAIFPHLFIDMPVEGVTLRAVTGGVAAASAPFDVEQPPAVLLIFSVQPSTSRVQQPIQPAIEVTALAADGDPVPWFNGPVSLGLVSNVLGAVAQGTLTVSAEGGVARFSNVRVDRLGLDYRLTAAFAGATPAQTSNAFAVIP